MINADLQHEVELLRKQKKNLLFELNRIRKLNDIVNDRKHSLELENSKLKHDNFLLEVKVENLQKIVHMSLIDIFWIRIFAYFRKGGMYDKIINQ